MSDDHPHHEDRDVGRFDRWSGRYDRSLFQPVFFHRVHRDLVGALSPAGGEQLLDVGCGTGAFADRAAHRGALVTGVDAAFGMIRVARSREGSDTARFCVAAAEALPFEDESFDAVVSAVSAHHWADVVRGASEALRVLRPGGRILIADIGSLGPVMGVLKRSGKVDPGHHQGWAAGDLAEVLYQAGFVSASGRTRRVMGGQVVTVRAYKLA